MPTTLKEFEAVFPSLVEELTEHTKQYGPPSDALKWFQDVCLPSSTPVDLSPLPNPLGFSHPRPPPH